MSEVAVPIQMEISVEMTAAVISSIESALPIISSVTLVMQAIESTITV